ncbi:MAG: OsmC family protein [Rhodospirillaceae bacterium]|jgi:uncharacterized OsmC-like protein|nr:OsmC family protein [Rhodospirillaceae bacterium]
MMNNTNVAATEQPTCVNGVNVDHLMGVIENIQADESVARMQFRLNNKWIDGGLNRSRIKDFFAAGQEDDTRTDAFSCDNDEPAIMAGMDSAPNPVEYVLHALAGCLATTVVYHAAVRGIAIDAIDSSLEGDMDVRGLLGLSNDVRKGYHDVRVTMRIKTSAHADEIRELAMFSAVYDIVSNSLPVNLVIVTY